MLTRMHVERMAAAAAVLPVHPSRASTQTRMMDGVYIFFFFFVRCSEPLGRKIRLWRARRGLWRLRRIKVLKRRLEY